MRIITILFFVVCISTGCKSLQSAIDATLKGGLRSSSTGVGSSLSTNDNTFGSDMDILDDADGSQKFYELNTHFNNVEYLTNKTSGVEQPSSLAYSYFDIMESFQRGVTNTNINSKDESGKTPLVAAIEKNDIAMVRFLISKNAKVDEDALTAAKSSGNASIQELLEQ